MAWFAVVDGKEYKLPSAWNDDDRNSLMESFATAEAGDWVHITQVSPNGVAHILMRPSTTVHVVQRPGGKVI